MDGPPRQHGTLGGFILAVSELDPELRIFAQSPWTAAARAIATASLSLRRVHADADFYTEVFGDGPESPEHFESFPFFADAHALKAELKRLRKAGQRDPTALCDAVIAWARTRNGIAR